MFEAKPTASGSGWPQLGPQLPPRGDPTLCSGRIGFGDCLVGIRAHIREPLAALSPETHRRVGIYSLAPNLKTAKALGFDMPTSILLRADEVIE
jgi:hypothetical protein